MERCGPDRFRVPMPAKHDQRMLGRWPSTIWDVARDAGVSVSTVSKALNGRGQLRAETRSLVQSAAARLNFRPLAGIGTPEPIGAAAFHGMAHWRNGKPFLWAKFATAIPRWPSAIVGVTSWRP